MICKILNNMYANTLIWLIYCPESVLKVECMCILNILFCSIIGYVQSLILLVVNEQVWIVENVDQIVRPSR